MYPSDDYQNSLINENHRIRNQLTIVSNDYTLLCKKINSLLDTLPEVWFSEDDCEYLVKELRKIMKDRRINEIS